MFGLPIWLVFLTFAAVSAVARDWRTAISGGLLLVNWSILTLNYHVSNDQFDWKLNCAVDWFTAALVFCSVFNRTAALLALIFIAEIFLAHLHYALSGRLLLDQQDYWDRMHYAVWLQAAVLGVSSSNGVWRRIRDFRMLARHSLRHRSFFTRGAGR